MKKLTVLFIIIIAGTSIPVFIVQSCKSKTAETNKAATAAEFVFREKLSDYGFFKEPIHKLLPAGQLLNYELATPLFTDYTVKDRFIVLPRGKLIQFKAQGVLDFPDSTIIVKNFAYRNTSGVKTMIETRLLVKDPFDKKWKVMNYLWNKEQTDAMKHITGAKVPVTLLDDNNNKIFTIYQVPNTNDCKRCHINKDVLTPIGPKAGNLNFTRAGQTTNQLLLWASLNNLSGLHSIAEVEQLPDWKDANRFTVTQRARAYLDANCAHCHTAGGDAENTGLFLEYEQSDPQKLGMMKAPVSAGNGAGGLNYDIVPGDAAHSVLAYRMNSTEPGTAMPELARTIVHKEAVQLITDWINQLHQSKN